MREIRLSGSEGGARFKPWFLPLSFIQSGGGPPQSKTLRAVLRRVAGPATETDESNRAQGWRPRSMIDSTDGSSTGRFPL